MKIYTDLEGIAFENGSKIVQSNGYAIIGMSLKNSYFCKENILELLRFCVDRFSLIEIMIADIPSEHTYKALGYEPKTAKRKARLNGNTLRNHCKRSIGQLSGCTPIIIIDWKEDVENNEEYQREYTAFQRLYNDNQEFRQDVRRTTGQVIEGELINDCDPERAIDEGVHYLLKELAFISTEPKRLGREIAYIYHQHWNIFENFVKGKYGTSIRKDLGFVLIE